MDEVHHNPARDRFEVVIDDHVAELTYHLSGDRIVFTHTFVPDEFRGRGIGAALVKAGLKYAAQQSLQVVPQCSFVAAYIKRNAE